MKVVILPPHGGLERGLTGALLAAGHDVRLAGARAGAGPLPVGARCTDTMSADVLVTVVGGLTERCGASEAGCLRDLAVVAARAAAANLVVVALGDVTRVEDVLARHATAWTLQAATTPHAELHRALLARCAGGRVTVPVERLLQPVDAGVVTDRVVRLVRAGPAGRVPDVGGPAIALAGDLAAAWARRMGGVRITPCPPGCRCWDGALLAPGRLTGQLDWSGWLDRRSDLELAEGGEEPGGAEVLGAPAGVGQER